MRSQEREEARTKTRTTVHKAADVVQKVAAPHQQGKLQLTAGSMNASEVRICTEYVRSTYGVCTEQVPGQIGPLGSVAEGQKGGKDEKSVTIGV